MRIAFLMDPLSSIDPTFETTSHLMYECNQRGHTVYFLEPHDVYVRNNAVVARMRNVTVPPDKTLKAYWRAAIRALKDDRLLFESVTDLDAIFLRKNPPLVRQVVEFLEPVSDRVFMINSTRGQVIANSKLYVLNFPDLIPETHVSRDPVRLRKIIDDFGGTMVVKPLGEYGGHGVIKVSARDPENLSSLINYYVGSHRDYASREAIVVQEYLEEVRNGDVRILLLNGEILGAMRRKSAEGDFRTNVSCGGKVYPHAVTPEESRVCSAIAERLVRDGLYFVGLDLIGGKLVEINCVSPGGIPRINRLIGAKLEGQVVDFVEEMVRKGGEGPKTGCSERLRPTVAAVP